MATKRVNIDIVAKDKSQQALNKVRGNLDGVKKAVFNVRNALAGIGGGLVIRSLINTGKQIEGLQVRLKFLFGSAQEGAKAFEEMAKFASKVPFSLEEIQSGSGNLAVVAKDAKELAHLMEITGNVAAATGLDFRTTAEQVQRSLSAGISAADLFRDRGVKAMLGFKAGATVSIEETAEAFDRVFGKGGEFGGTTDALAQTLEGTLSMIGDKVFNFKKTLLDEGFFAELKNQFGDLNKFLGKNQESLDDIARTIGTNLAKAVVGISEGIKILADNFDQLKAAVGGFVAFKLAGVIIAITKAVRNLRLQTVGLVALTGPKGLALIAGAFVAMKIAASDFVDEVKKAEESIKDLTLAGIVLKIQQINDQIQILVDRNNELNSSMQSVADGGEKMNGHFDFLNNTLDQTPEKLLLMEQQMLQNDQIIAGLNIKLAELNKLLNLGGNKKIIDTPHALLEHEASPEDVRKRTKKEKEKADAILAILEKNKKDSILIFHEMQQTNEEINNKAIIAQINKKSEEKNELIKIEKEKQEEVKKILDQNKIDSIKLFHENTQNETKAKEKTKENVLKIQNEIIEKEKEKEEKILAILQKNKIEGMNIHQDMLDEKLRLNNIEVEAEQIKQDKIVALKKQGNKEITDNTRSALSSLSGLNRTAFEAFKRFQIAEATINAVKAASTAFTTYAGNPLMAFAVSASALAKGMAMVAQIKSTNYRAGGGSVNKDQAYMVGEKGPEMFVPSGSGKIVPNNQMGGGQPVNVNFNINTVDARGFNELLTNSRGVIVNMINSAVNETGRQAIV